VSDASYIPLALTQSFRIVSSPNVAKQQSKKTALNKSNILVMSDPLFDTADSYVDRLTRDNVLAKDPVWRSTDEKIASLPETRIEADQIKKTFLGQNVISLYQENANEDWLKKSNLAPFKYMHFATHGVTSGGFPGLYEPALLLTSTHDNDGLLTASEISNLDLDSDLVVLSACDTAVDKYNRGDAIMGLVRSFKLAGSDAVIGTLWPIPSEPTVVFMSHFYKKLASGLSAKESLNETQRLFIDAISNRLPYQYSNPIYWAAFTLYDDNHSLH